MVRLIVVLILVLFISLVVVGGNKPKQRVKESEPIVEGFVDRLQDAGKDVGQRVRELVGQTDSR